MTSFHFSLEKVLAWRRVELDLAETRFKQQAAVLADLNRQQAELEAVGIRTEVQVRQWKPVSGSDLMALDGFRLHVKVREKDLSAQTAACRQELERRQSAMLEARRRLRLLERLRERRLAEWRVACDRELEEEAAVSYLARWSRR